MRKNYKHIAIGLLIIGGLLSAATLDYSNIFGVIGLSALILSALSSLISLNLPANFEKKINFDDWKRSDSNSYFILVSGSAHAMSNSSTVTVFEKESGIYSEVDVSIKTSESGNVIIGANSKFEGKLVIK